jgi:putative membrane protein
VSSDGTTSDPGLQPERTALAWRRTALAFTVGPLAAARLLAPQSGLLSALAALFGLALGISVAVAAWARYRAVHRALTVEGEARQLPGGALLLISAVVPCVAGVVALGVLVLRQ